MTSTDSKKARSISSLFGMGNSKVDSPSATPPANAATHLHTPSQDKGRGLSPIHHSASAQNLSPYPTPLTSHTLSPPPRPHSIADPALGSPLLPPPSLANLDPARTGSPSSPGSRPRSSGGSRLASPASLSAPGGSRPGTPNDTKLAKRRSWLPSKPPATSVDESNKSTKAWIAGLETTVAYDLTPLLTAQTIPELWDEQGDTFVYLFPQNSGKGPSCRFDSSIYAASRPLTFLARGGNISRRTSTDRDRKSVEDATSQLRLSAARSPPLSAHSRSSDDGDSSGTRRLVNGFPEDQYQEAHLYVPVSLNSDVSGPQPRLSSDDVETLVLFRNLWAFIVGQALVATPRHPSLFSIFMGISGLLQRFEFSNLDGSTYGEVAAGSFARYCEELKLADVRASREKTIEAIVLGERMRSWSLYNEGFVHGVGKLGDIKGLNSPKFSLVSPITRNRMERAFIDLEKRLHTVKAKLDEFDFPSLFSGIANSSVATESKFIRFKAWKASFLAFRKHTVAHYRQKYGSWPPKARSKKNDFEESGLNRLLLKELYHDFTDLYDMLVDRKSLTTRSSDMPSHYQERDQADPQEPTPRALRRVMSEYDRSTPPVQPPIPFDTPLLPTLASIRRGSGTDPRKDARERTIRLKDGEVNEILLGSYNHASIKANSFLEEFMRLERRSGHGKTVDELVDMRNGQWLFMYAVLQSLPMLVVDAPDVKFTRGVEYFLCEPPRGVAPWSKEDTSQSRSWYGIAGGTGVVSLPSEIIEHGVEGIYRRSHCWQAASKWAGESEILSTAIAEPFGAPLPPPGMIPGMPSRSPQLSPHSPGLALVDSRNSSPGGRGHSRSSIHLGLEALPLPAGVVPVEQQPRPVSRLDPSKNFDVILAGVPVKKGKK